MQKSLKKAIGGSSLLPNRKVIKKVFISTFDFNFFIHGNPLSTALSTIFTVLQRAMLKQNLIITEIYKITPGGG